MSVRDKFFNDDTRENASFMHKKIWKAIRSSRFLNDWLFLQEQTIHTNKGALYVDILCKTPMKVAIEIQGEQHSKFIKHFHTTYSNFKKQKERDKEKEQWLIDNGYKFIKFYTYENLSDDEITFRIIQGLNQ